MPQPALSNSIDLTRNYLAVHGPGAGAGQYTSNPNGSQTAQRQQANSASQMPQKQAADYQRGVNFLLQDEAADYEFNQAQNLAGNQSYLSGLGSFANMEDPAAQAQMYRNQQLSTFRMSPGGEDMIKRADKMFGQAVSPVGLRTMDRGQEMSYRESLFNSGKQDRYERMAGDQYNSDEFEVRIAQTSAGPVAIKKMANGEYALTSRTGAMGDDDLAERDARIAQAGERLKTDTRTQARGMETAIQRGKLNAASRAWMEANGVDPKDVLGKDGRIDRAAFRTAFNGKPRGDSQVAQDNPLKPLPTGAYSTEGKAYGAAHIEKITNPQAPEDAKARDHLVGVGINPDAFKPEDLFDTQGMYNSLSGSTEDRQRRAQQAQAREHMRSLPPQERREQGKAVIEFLQSHMAQSEFGTLEGQADIDPRSQGVLKNLSQLDAGDDAQVDAWVSDWLNEREKHHLMPGQNLPRSRYERSLDFSAM